MLHLVAASAPVGRHEIGNAARHVATSSTCAHDAAGRSRGRAFFAARPRRVAVRRLSLLCMAAPAAVVLSRLVLADGSGTDLPAPRATCRDAPASRPFARRRRPVGSCISVRRKTSISHRWRTTPRSVSSLLRAVRLWAAVQPPGRAEPQSRRAAPDVAKPEGGSRGGVLVQLRTGSRHAANLLVCQRSSMVWAKPSADVHVTMSAGALRRQFLSISSLRAVALCESPLGPLAP